MFRPRVVLMLLISNRRLVKTQRFRDPMYLGDPVNAIRIFNDKGVDEIVVLDIAAPREGRGPDYAYVAQLSGESFVPFAYGGGVSSADDAERLVRAGVEKVVVNTAALRRPEILREIANRIGSQSVLVALDAKPSFLGGYRVYGKAGSMKTSYSPVEFAKLAERMGAGEIVVTGIHREGTAEGYDLALVADVVREVGIPVVANGGARSLDDARAATTEAGAAAAAAGSMFVFKGHRKGILLSYPDENELDARMGATR